VGGHRHVHVDQGRPGDGGQRIRKLLAAARRGEQPLLVEHDRTQQLAEHVAVAGDVVLRRQVDPVMRLPDAPSAVAVRLVELALEQVGPMLLLRALGEGHLRLVREQRLEVRMARRAFVEALQNGGQCLKDRRPLASQQPHRRSVETGVFAFVRGSDIVSHCRPLLSVAFGANLTGGDCQTV
jgi:hypothetical protein